MFDDDLRQLALSNAPEPIAHIGDIVTTEWGDWKYPHRVMIYRVCVSIVVMRRQAGDPPPIMGVEHEYSALRLGKNDIPKEKYGIALTSFTTEEGIYWEKRHLDFNHCGLSFNIEEIPEDERMPN